MHHISTIPKLCRPRLAKYGSVISAPILMQYSPYMQDEIDPNQPRRKSMIAPPDNNTFVKPIKQSFVKNPRMMPMTKMMLSLLAGWAGQGGCIDTTTGVIGKHLSRSRRMVFKYLKDAQEEGLLNYTRRKDRIGRYIGIKIWINFSAILFTKLKKPKTTEKTTEKLEVNYSTDTNSNIYLNKKEDDLLWAKLTTLAHTMGFISENKPPT
jgi:hypothetical protein